MTFIKNQKVYSLYYNRYMGTYILYKRLQNIVF